MGRSGPDLYNGVTAVNADAMRVIPATVSRNQRYATHPGSYALAGR